MNDNTHGETIHLGSGGRSDTPKSVNFGPGVEMLMNDKKKVVDQPQKVILILMI